MKLKKQIDENRTVEGISKSIYQFLGEQNIAEKVEQKIQELEAEKTALDGELEILLILSEKKYKEYG